MANTGRRLAKNTIYMYIRMFVTMIVSFYTSRVVLQELGVEDFGIYNLVGSVVAMFNSLRAIFASSTQRYLNYEMGRKNANRLNLIFNMGLYITIIIALIFIILVETVGIWFFEFKINVAPDRLKAAFTVFQFSVLTAVVSMITTLYDAELIAHEKMNFYATMSIIETLLKLGIVYLLIISSCDKLIIYGFLHFIISAIVLSINAIFCRLKFEEVRINRLWNKSQFKEMTSFAGWNFFGNTSYALTQNGLNMILNIFGGTIVNAARGIALQLNSALLQFITNINIVLNPYCIKLYAEGNIGKMFRLTFLSSKILFCVQLCITIPFCYCSYLILDLWLGEVPKYSVIFLQLVLIQSQIRSLHPSLDILFKASGKLRWYQIREGIVLALPLLTGYLSLKAGMNIAWAFIGVIIFECINIIQILFLAKTQVCYPTQNYIREVILPCSIIFLLSSVFYFIFIYNKDVSTLFRIISSLTTCLISIASMYYIGFNEAERNNLISIIRQ